MWCKTLRKSTLLVALSFASLMAQAQNVIESVTSSMQSGVEVIKIDLSQALTTPPAGFSIQAPARVVLDLPNVGSGSVQSAISINQGNVRSANVIQAGERTRVVLNLKQTVGYKTQLQGKSVLVFLDAVAAASSSAAPVAVFAENLNRDTLALKDVDFRRGVDNSGRIVVDLANNQVGVDIRQQGQNLVVEFLKTTMPEGLRRRLDVADFGTPVQFISTFQTGDRVRMVIEPKGAWEHSAYQSDNQFVIEVRQQKVDPAKLTQGVGFNGEKLTLNFQNIEIRSLLAVIADFTKFNIITSDSVTGSVTLRLKDVPWDQALDIILQTKGLGMRKTGNVLRIAPKDELANQEKQDFEAKAAIQNIEPLVTQSFQLNYTKAGDIALQIQPSGSSTASSARGLLSSRGSVIAEPRTNQLFVTDIPSKLAQVQELVTKLDIAVRQVLIEARIVEAVDTFGKSLGVKWGGSDLTGVRGGSAGQQITKGPNGGNRIAFGGNYDAVSMTTGETVNGLNTVNTQLLNLAAVGLNAYNPASLGISLFSSVAGRFLNLELSALEADGNGKVVASPRIVTADQTKALIEQGTEYPYQVATASGATSLAFRKANLKLEVTPQITPEGNIILDLDINKDSRGETTLQGIAINTKHVKTQVLVENGGTVVIGGIFLLEETLDETKVPVLGDVPLVGNLFKTKTRKSEKRELLVFITPKMITDRASVR
ncbi:MAG: type IV pilus secretin PilQ [Burkholderiaceae bacterium]|nr:type IV pilus secretin PilQ [Burkholderiaceae bacterium]